MSLIKVRNLEKTYLGNGVITKALRGLSFDIQEGEFVSIIGASGSGKSTLLHILSFLDRPTKGIYQFRGKSIDELSDEELALIRNEKMGFVFQSFNLLRGATVLENVELPLLYSNIKEDRKEKLALKAILDVGLPERLLEHKSSQLSGGEKQRVAIARAIVNSPRVIFADEPTGNLDTKSGEIVVKTLQELWQQGRTIVLVTHETPIAEYAERVIKLSDGKIVYDKKVLHQKTVSEDGFYK